MARSKVQGGGNYSDWLAYAEDEPLVMFRRIQQLSDKDFDNGPAKCVLVDAQIITGPDKGTTITDDEVVGKGMTNELLRLSDGDDLPCKIVIKKRGKNEYPAIVKITADEEAKIDKVFPPDEEDDVWSDLRKAAKRRKRDEDDDEERGTVDEDERDARRARRDAEREVADADRRGRDRARSRDDDEDDEPPRRSRSRSRDEDDDEDEPPARRKRERPWGDRR